ncbi:relA-associated inhibitor [Platysternon megacephalum]|uniref:RelA-associated inhibitor n=1 Tax=Platysternon megacephalum TaxID=55544 RepID=A0A4D9DL49_9SAUR|nr:relA-associated inhibitor [Platysternon megacephalum]
MDDKKVRHVFIRKVYTIISVQLLVTVGIIAVFTFVSPVRNFVQRNIAVYYCSYAVFLVTYLVLACCQGPRRRFPWNLILLSIFTLAMAFMTGAIARYWLGNPPLSPFPPSPSPSSPVARGGGGGKERVHRATCPRVGVARPAGEGGSDGEENQPHPGSNLGDPLA